MFYVNKLMMFKFSEVKILRHPSASRPDGPDPPFANVAAFRIKNLSISWITGWIHLIGPSISTSGGGSLDSECFCFSSCSVASVSGKTLFDMLFISNAKAPFTLPLLIKIRNFIGILIMVLLLSGNFNLYCIVCPSYSSSSIFPSYHYFSLLSRPE